MRALGSISIRDVCPRDGLQSERPLDPRRRADLAIAVADAGLVDIEACSLVSPKAVPSMAGGGEVFAALPRHPDLRWWALVPNARGAELALSAGVQHITVTISASDGYSHKNVGVSTETAIEGLTAIGATVGGSADLDVVVSRAFGSPFGDVLDEAPTAAIVSQVLDVLPTARLTLADTTGTATPRRISTVLNSLPRDAPSDVGLHLHDTRGTALANALAAIEGGVRRFDTSTGGLGGSPFAPGAGGNLATEDLVLMVHDLGYTTGIDLEALLTIAGDLSSLVGHPIPGRVAAAGVLPPFRS